MVVEEDENAGVVVWGLIEVLTENGGGGGTSGVGEVEV